jgi:putative membrane protein
MSENSSDLQLREAYAKERTILALDRTVLSYVRTAMTSIVVGVSFFKFFSDWRMQAMGALMIIVAIILTAFSIVRTVQVRKQIDSYTSHD